MSRDSKKNQRLVCVDDEQSMLDSYQQILAPQADPYADLLEPDECETGTDAALTAGDYELFLANSGQEAVRIVKEQIAKGEPIAAGFFDMRMPGGIDGYDTVKQIRALDPNMICAIVTAYTDRKVAQIRSLFDRRRQDELLYFKKPFTAAELEQTAVNMVSAWNRKRAEEEHVRIIEKNRRGLQYIIGAMGDLSDIPPRTLRHLLSGILYHTLALIDGENGYIATLDDHEQFLMAATAGRFETVDIPALLSSDPEVGRALREGLDDRIDIRGTQCLFPLIYSNRRLGLVYLESRRQMEGGVEREMLSLFRNQIIPMILNTLLYDEILKRDVQVLTDPLTGLFNRRFILRRLEQELARSARYSYPLSLLMLDLDNFKQLNDTYGHVAGDEVLKGVGELLQHSVRDYDVVGRNVDGTPEAANFAIRYGGEEFTVILAHTDGDGALQAAERIREMIAEHPFAHNGQLLDVSASIGVTTRLVDTEHFERDEFIVELVQEADRALYRAKAKGKNRVEAYCRDDRGRQEDEQQPSALCQL